MLPFFKIENDTTTTRIPGIFTKTHIHYLRSNVLTDLNKNKISEIKYYCSRNKYQELRVSVVRPFQIITLKIYIRENDI